MSIWSMILAVSNIYFYKKDSLETSKLQADPIWDFSGCMGKVPFKGEWSYSHYPDNYVNYNGELNCLSAMSSL